MLKQRALQRNLPGLIRMLKQHALQRNLPGLFRMLKQHPLQHVIIQFMTLNIIHTDEIIHTKTRIKTLVVL
jgi:very-short-patch-repair endonuclease